MNVLTVTFALAAPIARGIASGLYARYGGVIREVATGKIVAFLHELGSDGSNTSQSPNGSSTNLLNLIFSETNLGSVASATVAGRGLTNVSQRLD